MPETLLAPAPAAVGSRHFAPRRGRLRPLDAVFAAGAGTWAYGLTRIDLARMGDTGLISVLGGWCIAGLCLLGAGLVAQLVVDPGDRWRAVGYQVALVVALDGLPCITEASAGIPTGYIHVGFAAYILAHGHVLNNYDARFSWPGMFAWAAIATVATGRQSAMVFLRFTPVVLDLIYLLPLRLLARRVCADQRVAWLALALFTVTNWTEQDYFSPQGFAYVAYLAVLAVLLAGATSPALRPAARTLRARAGLLARRCTGGGQADPVLAFAGRRARIGVTVSLAVVMAALVSSHQLTPYGLLAELVVLALFGRLASPVLAVVLGIGAIAYLNLGAENFWSGHLSAVFGDVGSVGGSVSAGLVARTHVSAGHLLVVQGRLVLTAALGAVAFAGFLLRRRAGRPDTWLVAGLAVAPWGLAGLQSYGGEVFIRSLFLSLPFLGILAAEALVAVVAVARRAGTVAVAVVLVATSFALVATRYGNEPFYETTPAEITAVNWVDDTAAPGSTIAVLTQDLPWRFADIDRFHFVSYEAACATGFTVACLRRVDAGWIVLTEGQIRFAELDGGATPAQIGSITRDLAYVGYRPALSLPGATVYQYVATPVGVIP